MKPYILGLDLGPNSIGWAMLATDPTTLEPTGFLDTEHAGHPPLGVRVFEAGLQNFETAKEMSLNQSRRTARSMRRNHARRNARRRRLREQLVEFHLLPKDSVELEEVLQADPYPIRARAVVEIVDPYEIGRAIYHLNQRRGFKSNRKSGQAKEDEGILEEIGVLEKAISDGGFTSLGQYLFHLLDTSDGRTRLRNRHTRRDMYQAEFHAIVTMQRQHHSDLLTNHVVQALEQTIFFQHPFEITDERREEAPPRANLHRAPSVRPCLLEPDRICCHRGLWEAQQFRIYKEVANLRISEQHRRERELTPVERDAVLSLLFAKDRVKFDDLRRSLMKLGTDPEAQFNLERGDRKHLLGNSVEHRLAATVGRPAWNALDEQTKDRLRHAVCFAEDPDEIRTLLQEIGVTADKANKLANWTPGDGYLGYSLVAVRKLLPLLQKGMDEYEAIRQAYPNRPEARRFDLLPALMSSQLPAEITNLTNPVVRRALVELRKVVNTLVRDHGPPARVVVEMAREMKDGSERRRDYNRRIRDRESRRQRAAEEVAKMGGNPHSRDDLNRWLIWEEQGGICLYTGRPIPVSELFHGGEWEIDHILPRWRSLDDSLMNKVLVHRDANKNKGDRTPAEWLGEESEEFKLLVRRAYGVFKGNPELRPKLDRIKTDKLDTDAFTLRQLNDTRYLTRVVIQYLSLLYPVDMRTGEKAIQSCRGGLTAELRRQWGMNNVLPVLLDATGKPFLTDRTDDEGNPLKSREDHRHHAVDAVVIALSSRRFLKRYQDYWKARELKRTRGGPDFPAPWPEFRADVRDFASRITVSHRPLLKISGPFHEETFYGPARDRDGNIAADRYVTRKPLDKLTGNIIANIRDATCRRLIEARLKQCGWDGRSNTLPSDWYNEPILMKSGVPIKKIRVETVIKNAAQLKHRYAILGNNHHLEIVAGDEIDEAGRPVPRWATVVSTLEAAERVRRRHEPVVRRDHGDGKKFLMSLARKESVEITNPATGERIVGIVQMVSGSPNLDTGLDMTIRDARDSRQASTGNRQPFKRFKSFRSWKDFGLVKIQVDPIGRVRPAND